MVASPQRAFQIVLEASGVLQGISSVYHGFPEVQKWIQGCIPPVGITEVPGVLWTFKGISWDFQWISRNSRMCSRVFQRKSRGVPVDIRSIPEHFKDFGDVPAGFRTFHEVFRGFHGIPVVKNVPKCC